MRLISSNHGQFSVEHIWALWILNYKSGMSNTMHISAACIEHAQLDQIQSILVISNSKGLTEILRDIRTSTYQSWENEENNKLNNHI